MEPTSLPTPRPASAAGRSRPSLAPCARASPATGRISFPPSPIRLHRTMRDDDIKALYAYLMTRQPVRATVPPNTVPFPLTSALLQEGWKILFFRSEPLPARLVQERRMESRSLSRRGGQRLWRLSHAAQCARRRKSSATPMRARWSTTGSRRRSTPGQPLPSAVDGR